MADMSAVRLVLDDCRLAHAELSTAPWGSPQFRVRWVACLTLLQTCKDVLFASIPDDPNGKARARAVW